MKSQQNLENVKSPSTRFLGSKLKLSGWIWNNIKELDFISILDAFGGTASVSHIAKLNGKKVFYNDVLKFNQQIGLALVENDRYTLSNLDVRHILKKHDGIKYPSYIRETFPRMYFTQRENGWLDKVVTNISSMNNKYKKAIAYSALFQACLIKRPFNLFHRNNLNLRFNNVKRTFGNKTSWDGSFRKHFTKFVKQYNAAVFDNNQNNKVLGGKDIFQLPRKFDLIYLDPPYISNKSSINYLDCYHFLEGLVQYKRWKNFIDEKSSTKKFKSNRDVEKWTSRDEIKELFRKMISHFKKSKIVLSYRDDGVPSPKEISQIFEEVTGKKPIRKSKKYKYALSNRSTHELLFIHEN